MNPDFSASVLPDAGAAVPARITSQDLFRQGKEVVIVHNGREYRLRITQNGKLILTA